MLLALGNLKPLARASCRCLLVAIAPILLTVHMSAAARAEEESAVPIVALAYDKETNALLKSDGQALFRSRDDGETWERMPLPAGAAGKVMAIATPPGGNGVVFIAGPGLGVLRTENDGADWITSDGLPSSNVTSFAAHATQPATLYAHLPESGIYRSQDAGKSWRLMDVGPEGMSQLIHSSMAGSMESGWLYAATNAGVQLAMDCFCFWREAGGLGGAVRNIAFDHGEPTLVYAAAERGVFRSADGGQTWSPAASPDSNVTALVVGSSGVLFAATADGQLHHSADQAATWERAGD